MHLFKVLHSNILSSVTTLHQRRATALAAAVEALISGARLSVTHLGRALNSTARPKHNIKRMDRLASNRHLHAEHFALYRALCHHLCAHLKHPIVLVDWTDIVEQKRLMLIRAALAVDGRALTLYEAVYPLKRYNAPRTHKRFLNDFHALMPEQCIPIIVTDAGFRGPWFKAVEKHGWFWLGRVRNCINYRLKSRYIWRKTTRLYARATAKPRYLGLAALSSKRPYECHLYLYKKRSLHRHANRSVTHFAKHSTSKVFHKQQKTPWLLATNLPPQQFGPQHIIKLYGKRMQIEQAFRDLKSDKFGFGLTLSRSRSIERLKVLMLIAALATLGLWWVGLHAKEQQWQRHFQANTVRDRNVLSVPFLALAVLARIDYSINLTELISAQRALLQLIYQSHQL